MAARVGLIGNEERAIGTKELAEKRGEEEAGRFGIVAVAVRKYAIGTASARRSLREAIERYEQSAKAVEDEPNKLCGVELPEDWRNSGHVPRRSIERLRDICSTA